LRLIALGLLGDAVRDVMAEKYGELRPGPVRRRSVSVADTEPVEVTAGVAIEAAAEALPSVRGVTVVFDRDGTESRS
jgi:hypothetical protein